MCVRSIVRVVRNYMMLSIINSSIICVTVVVFVCFMFTPVLNISITSRFIIRRAITRRIFSLTSIIMVGITSFILVVNIRNFINILCLVFVWALVLEFAFLLFTISSFVLVSFLPVSLSLP